MDNTILYFPYRIIKENEYENINEDDCIKFRYD